MHLYLTIKIRSNEATMDYDKNVYKQEYKTLIQSDVSIGTLIQYIKSSFETIVEVLEPGKEKLHCRKCA